MSEENENEIEFYWPTLVQADQEEFDPDVMFKRLVEEKGVLKSIVGLPGCPIGYNTVKRYSKQYNFHHHYKMHVASLERVNRQMMKKMEDDYDESNTIKKAESLLDSIFKVVMPRIELDTETNELKQVWDLPPQKFEATVAVAVSLMKEIKAFRGSTQDLGSLEKIVKLNIDAAIKIFILTLQNLVTQEIISTGTMYKITADFKDLIQDMRLVLELKD